MPYGVTIRMAPVYQINRAPFVGCGCYNMPDELSGRGYFYHFQVFEGLPLYGETLRAYVTFVPPIDTRSSRVDMQQTQFRVELNL